MILMIYVFGAATAVFLVLFILERKNRGAGEQRIQGLATQLEEAHQENRERLEQLDLKGRQAEETQSKLNKLREEMKKIKKKAFHQEGSDKGPNPAEEAEMDKLQQETVARLRAEAKTFQTKTEQGLEEIRRLGEQLEKLRLELSAAKAATAPEPLVAKEKPAETTPPAVHPDRLQALERQVKDQDDKLEAARRKARNDSQIYKVTNSKLSLAMERIGYMEKTLAGLSPSPAPVRPAPAARKAAPESPVPIAEPAPAEALATSESEPADGLSAQLEKSGLPA